MMIPELGNLALIFALVLAVIQAVVPQLGVWRKHDGCMELSRITAVGQLFFTLFAFAALANAFLTNDFSVAYVAANSNIHLPLGYRFCAIWGAHEGSLLLWVLILSCWSALVAIFSRSLPLDILARVLSVMACIAIGFYLFLLTTSDPFVRLVSQAPLNGADLNPILQDPGLAIHPPIL